MMSAMIRAGEGTRTPESEISASSSVCRSAPPTPPAPAPPTASRSCDWQEQCHSPQPRTNERRGATRTERSGKETSDNKSISSSSAPVLIKARTEPSVALLSRFASSRALPLCCCRLVARSLALRVRVRSFVCVCVSDCSGARWLLGRALTHSLALLELALIATNSACSRALSQPTNQRPTVARSLAHTDTRRLPPPPWRNDKARRPARTSKSKESMTS